MKQQSTLPKTKAIFVFYTATIVLNLIENVKAFVPSIIETHSPITFSKCIESSNDSSFVAATSLSMAFSMDTISASLRPFGSWYSQEDPIAQSPIYDNFSEEDTPSSLMLSWDANYFTDEIYPDTIIEEHQSNNRRRLPFFKATKQLANWTRKKMTMLLLTQCGSNN